MGHGGFDRKNVIVVLSVRLIGTTAVDILLGLLVIAVVLTVFVKILRLLWRQWRTGSLLAALDPGVRADIAAEFPAGSHMAAPQTLKVLYLHDGASAAIDRIGLETHAYSGGRHYVHAAEISLADAGRLADILEKAAPR